MLAALVMHEVELTLSPARVRSALKRGLATGILPDCDDLVWSMPADEVRTAVERLVLMMLAREIQWLEERHIPCDIHLTDTEYTFVFGFGDLSAALLFESMWGAAGDLERENGRE